MIDQFTLQEFKDALPYDKYTGAPHFHALGIIQGEYCFLVPIDDRTGILIRSSVDRSGLAAESGKDSIRCWIVEFRMINDIVPTLGNTIGGKSARWITRVSGWDQRLIVTIKKMWRLRKRSGDCPFCNKPKRIFQVKKNGVNRGRLFTKCHTCRGEGMGFQWLT